MIALLLLVQTKWGQCKDWLRPPYDPHQFERVDQGWLEREAERLQIKAQWRALSTDDRAYLDVLEGELRKRRALDQILKPQAIR